MRDTLIRSRTAERPASPDLPFLARSVRAKQFEARFLTVLNLFTDPRATTASHFAGSVGVAPPPAPVLSAAGTGGTMAYSAYNVQISYVTASGETFPSPTATITVPAGTGTLTIPSPPAAAGATGWYAYVSRPITSSPDPRTYRQQAAGSPTAIGTAFTLTAPPTTSGANTLLVPTAGAGGAAITQAPTNRADGYQQLATPMSCQEIVATLPAGTYCALATTMALGSVRMGQVRAARMAAKVQAITGGGNWHVALVLVNYSTGPTTKQGEVVVWSSAEQSTGDSTALATSLGGANGWFTVEGFDNQEPNTPWVSYYELELRLYNDSTNAQTATLRGTEIVQCVDPENDIPYYVGGDLNVGGNWSGIFAKWTGTADASTSIGMFDPASVYARKFETGTNDYSAWNGSISAANEVKIQVQEMGFNIVRAPAVMVGGQASPYIAPALSAANIAYLQALAQSGVKLLLAFGPPSWMMSAGYTWPKDDTAGMQTNFANAVVAAIRQIGPQYVERVMLTNEPNGNTYGGTSGSKDVASYSAWITKVFGIIKAAFPNIKTHGGVIGAGISQTFSGNGTYWQTWLQGMYTNSAQYDVLDIHLYPPHAAWFNAGNNFYSCTSAPLIQQGNFYTQPVWMPADEGMDATLKVLKDIMASHNDTRQIFFSETSMSAIDERKQAQWYSLMYGRYRRDPRIDGACINGTADGTSQYTTSNYNQQQWGLTDGRTTRRFHFARQLARMAGQPELPYHITEFPTLYRDHSGLPSSSMPGCVVLYDSVGVPAQAPGLVVKPHTIYQVALADYYGNPCVGFGDTLQPTASAAYLLGTGGGLQIGQLGGAVDAAHAMLLVSIGAAGQTGLIIKAAAAATADLQQFQNSSGTVLAKVDPSGNIRTKVAGLGFAAAEGTGAKQGVATLAAGAVVVANTSVTATSRIFLTAQDNNTSGALRVSARTAGTSFTITSSNAADTGVVAYEIFEVG